MSADLAGTLSILKRLIAFPTVSDRPSRDLITYVSGYLADLGVHHHVFADASGQQQGLARQLTGDNSDNCVSCQTAAGHFQAVGYSTVICGPGSIAQAHQPDEFITAEQLRQGQAFLARLIRSMA